MYLLCICISDRRAEFQRCGVCVCVCFGAFDDRYMYIFRFKLNELYDYDILISYSMDIYCIGVIHTSFSASAVMSPTAFTISTFFFLSLKRTANVCCTRVCVASVHRAGSRPL